MNKDVKTFKQTNKNALEWVLEEEEEIININITLLLAKDPRCYLLTFHNISQAPLLVD